MTAPKWPVTSGRWPARTVGLTAVVMGLAVLVGCQQKMATQPGHRPYEESDMFPHRQSARPLVDGVVHRNQALSDDPLNTWLTAQGKAPKQTASYAAWVAEQQKAPVGADGKPLVDKDGKPLPPNLDAAAAKNLLDQALQPGSPSDPDNFVNTVPFEMTEADLKRGQVLYTAVCAECHGGAGWGNGKIPERGFLRPPSYHTDPKYASAAADWVAKQPAPKEGTVPPAYWRDGSPDWPKYERDWSRYVRTADGTAVPDFTGNGAGTSRGFYKYGLEIPLKDVPVGYIYQVIYWGYGGMGSHETQIPSAADRWRVAAFVRVLQYSQAVPKDKLDKKSEDAANGKSDGKHGEEKH